MSDFNFDSYVAGVVYLTESPNTDRVMCVYSNKEAAENSYEVQCLNYKVREISLLTRAD